jgi:hypothetical protein
MRSNDDLRHDVQRTDEEEPTRVIVPPAEQVPQQRSAADDETMVFRPNGGDRADDELTTRTDVESVGTDEKALDEDRPGTDRVTGESAGWKEQTTASRYDRATDEDEPTAVGQARVDQPALDTTGDDTVVRPPTADDEPTVYESSALTERTDEEPADTDETGRHAADEVPADEVAMDEVEAEEVGAADRAAPEPEPAAASAGMLPGAAPAAPVETLWGDGRSQEYRDRWREVQLLFVDEPRAAAEQAESLVSDVVEAFTAALSAQRDDLAGWQGAEKHDTEELRVAVRRYREFLNRLLDL